MPKSTTNSDTATNSADQSTSNQTDNQFETIYFSTQISNNILTALRHYNHNLRVMPLQNDNDELTIRRIRSEISQIYRNISEMVGNKAPFHLELKIFNPTEYKIIRPPIHKPTFERVSKFDLENLTVGSAVKIILADLNETGQERIWILVTQINENGNCKGLVNNEPLNRNLAYQDEIRFHVTDIIQIHDDEENENLLDKDGETEDLEVFS